MIDLTTDFGRRVAARLEKEPVVWLTTISEHGIPQPRPVWFLWNGETVLTFSMAESYKVRHIQHNPNVALNFDSDGRGGDIVVITGTATFVEGDVPAHELDAYFEKYTSLMARSGLTRQGIEERFRAIIRITPQRVRGH